MSIHVIITTNVINHKTLKYSGQTGVFFPFLSWNIEKFCKKYICATTNPWAPQSRQQADDMCRWQTVTTVFSSRYQRNVRPARTTWLVCCFWCNGGTQSWPANLPHQFPAFHTASTKKAYNTTSATQEKLRRSQWLVSTSQQVFFLLDAPWWWSTNKSRPFYLHFFLVKVLQPVKWNDFIESI